MLDKNRFELLQIDTLSEADIIRIYEIEQDNWAVHLWEYGKCQECNNVLSKKDVFWHLSERIFINTTKSIENIIWKDNILSVCCQAPLEYLFGEEYIQDIIDRYKNTVQSFLCVYKEQNWIISGFIDGYMDSLFKIYEREFHMYYWDGGRRSIENIIINEKNIDTDLLFAQSSICMEGKYANMKVMKGLIYSFFYLLKQNWIYINTGIYEARLWGTIHKLFSFLWWFPLWIKSIWWENYSSDIFLHVNMTDTVLQYIEFINSWKKNENI